jgi:hypothetical protein
VIIELAGPFVWLSGVEQIDDEEEDHETRIDRAFSRFHADNPEIYDELVRLARETKGRGFRRLGIRMFWEVTRWNRMMRTDVPEGAYKMNDNYTSRYARLIMEREPDLLDVFETRGLRA